MLNILAHSVSLGLFSSSSGILGFFVVISTVKLRSLMAPVQCAAWIFFAKVSVCMLLWGSWGLSIHWYLELALDLSRQQFLRPLLFYQHIFILLSLHTCCISSLWPSVTLSLTFCLWNEWLWYISPVLRDSWCLGIVLIFLMPSGFPELKGRGLVFDEVIEKNRYKSD